MALQVGLNEVGSRPTLVIIVYQFFSWPWRVLLLFFQSLIYAMLSITRVAFQEY